MHLTTVQIDGQLKSSQNQLTQFFLLVFGAVCVEYFGMRRVSAEHLCHKILSRTYAYVEMQYVVKKYNND